MKKIIAGALIFASMVLGAAQADAQSRYHSNNAQQKIQRGVVHGKLTRTEARNLRLQQARIVQMKRMAMADGYISPKEKIMIAKAERRANRTIYIQKHDRQNRF